MSKRYVKTQTPSGQSSASFYQMMNKVQPIVSSENYGNDHISITEVLSLIPVMIFMTKPDGNWNYINPVLASFFGLESEVKNELNWMKLVHPEDQMDSLIAWQTSIHNGTPFHIEARFISHTRTYKYLYIHMVPYLNRNGICLHWIGVATPLIKEYDLVDHSDPDRMTDAIRDAVDQIISVTAHELAAPITVLMGQAKILQQRMALKPHIDTQDKMGIDMMVEQSQRLSKLLYMLMDASRIDHGQLYIDSSVLDVGALVYRLVYALQSVFTDHVLRVYVDVESVWILGDQIAIEQVMHNVIQNAVKYSPKGSEVKIHVTSDSDYVYITVQDNGMGIPRTIQPHLFERFVRATDRENQTHSGLGLGLYICKGIVDLHQGSIELASVVGEGTMVTISLPRYHD